MCFQPSRRGRRNIFLILTPTLQATLRFLESKYKDAPDLPTTESLQNRKKTLQRAREQQQPQRKEMRLSSCACPLARSVGGARSFCVSFAGRPCLRPAL